MPISKYEKFLFDVFYQGGGETVPTEAKKLCKNSSIDWPGVRGGGERKFSMVKYCLIIPKKHQIFTDFPENLSSLSFCKYYRG